MQRSTRAHPAIPRDPGRKATMRYRVSRTVVIAAVATALLASSMTASATPPSALDGVETFEWTKNMHPLGFSPKMIPDSGPGSNVFNSDLAFWGNIAVQGTYSGFRLIDISSPANPVEIIDWEDCASPTSTAGNQGDVIVWENLIIRSWNSPTPAAGSNCGNWPMSQGEEGVHIIDISDPTSPDVIGFVDTPCGSHTETLVPDLDNNRLLVYSSPSAGTFLGGDPGHPDAPFSCRGVDVVEVPLDDPASASYLRFLRAGPADAEHADLHACHDTGVILGDVMKAACAGGNSVTVWSMHPDDGGTLSNPVFQYRRTFPGVSIGHSASWTWDGEVLIFGHEPGGGGQAQCQATSSVVNRTLFFLDGETGDTVGTILHPRPQGPTENCTWHNLNVVPTDKGYVAVSGSYQSGISVVDFSDPANAHEIAYADPAPLIHPTNPNAILLGGSWSAYWYNGRIYDSDIRRGMSIWNVSHPAVAGAKKFSHSNPQTQEISFGKGPAFGKVGQGKK